MELETISFNESFTPDALITPLLLSCMNLLRPTPLYEFFLSFVENLSSCFIVALLIGGPSWGGLSMLS